MINTFKSNPSSSKKTQRLTEHKASGATRARRLIILSLAFVIIAAGLNACGGSSVKKTLTAEDQFARAKKLFEKHKYFESVEEFQKVVYNYPGSNLVDTAQFYLAKSYLEDEQYELAAVEFERLIKNYPRSGFGPDSRFLSGYARYLGSPSHYGLDQSELIASMRLMEDFIIDYPDSRMIPDAKQAMLEAHSRLAKKTFKSGMVYMHSRVFTSALIYFQKVIDEYAQTDFAALALLEKGKAQFMLNELEKSAATFNTFIAQYPSHKLVKNAGDELKKVEKKLSKLSTMTAAQESKPSSDSLLQPTTSGVDSSVDSPVIE